MPPGSQISCFCGCRPHTKICVICPTTEAAIRLELNGALLNALEVPAQHKPEQQALVLRIQAAMTEVDAIEASAKAVLADIERLPSRVLAQAFAHREITMANSRIAKLHHATFEGIRNLDTDGNEFWPGPSAGKVLDYSEYRHFLPVVERAREACRNSGQSGQDHFEDILDMVKSLWCAARVA